MLEGEHLTSIEEKAYRFANPRRTGAAVSALGHGESDNRETLAFLGAEYEETAEQLIDGVFEFRPDRPLRQETRFSDGTWAVLYTSLDWETARAERGHYISESTRHARLFRLECDLRTERALDLRSLAARFPYLIDPDAGAAYPSCQALAAEARTKSDALVTLSARRSVGVNAPVFKRLTVVAARLAGRVLLRAVDGEVLEEPV